MPNIAGQTVTISVTGMGDSVAPESIAEAVLGLVDLLVSADCRAWKIPQPRYEWGIIRAAMGSPLTVTLQARQVIPDAPAVDVVGAIMNDLGQLEHGQKPAGFSDQDLTNAQRLAGTGDDIVRVSSNGHGINTTTKVKATVEKLLAVPRPDRQLEHSSVEGVLRQITADDRKGRERHEFQIIDRESGQLITCRFNPGAAQDIASHIRQRVVAFGAITFGSAGLPEFIKVDDYRVIPDDLPQISDIHNLGLAISGDMDAADFIREQRGDVE